MIKVEGTYYMLTAIGISSHIDTEVKCTDKCKFVRSQMFVFQATSFPRLCL